MVSVFWARPDAAVVERRSAGIRGWLWVWLPAVLACLIIVGESTRTMSAQNTSAWLRPVFERLFGHVSDSAWDLIHHVIRKSGHFVGYGLVCLTFLRACLLTLGRRTEGTVGLWRLASVLRGVGSTFVVASCDEFHQTFVPGRTGLFSDVLLDTCGGLVMCGLVALLCRWWRAPSEAAVGGAHSTRETPAR